MTSSVAAAADAGPKFRIQTKGLGFTWCGSGPRNADTPEAAVSKLSLLDVANANANLQAPADRMPGSALIVGPLARDEDGAAHVLCWHRHAPGTTKESPGRISLVVVPAVNLDGQRWRDRMISEARRNDGRFGAVHFWQTRAVEDFRALPHVLCETFGRDGQGWAGVCDWWLQHAHEGATFAPWDQEQ